MCAPGKKPDRESLRPLEADLIAEALYTYIGKRRCSIQIDVYILYKLYKLYRMHVIHIVYLLKLLYST